MIDSKKLLNYHAWSNERVFEHLSQLPQEVFTREVESVFPTVEKTMEHILKIDHLWFSRISGMDSGQISVPHGNMVQMRALFQKLHTEMKNFIFPGRENELVTYTNSKGEHFSNRISEIILHLVNHGTYHRGNISAMLRQMGYHASSTDYIFYLRESELKRN